jgi:FkbM family methyltransferase
VNPAVYLEELGLSARLGCGVREKSRLFAGFAVFHLANRLRLLDEADTAKVHRYRVRWGAAQRDVYLRPRGGDFYVLWETFGRGIFAADERLRRSVDLASVRSFLDLGANTGLVSLYFSQYLPAADFICVEPDPGNALLLRRNLAFLGPRLRVVEAAIADRSGRITFDSSGASYRRRVGDASVSPHYTSVEAVTITQAIGPWEGRSPDLVKIDIEGAERYILEADLNWLAGTRAVLIELHPPVTEQALRQALEPRDFIVESLGVGMNFLAFRRGT